MCRRITSNIVELFIIRCQYDALIFQFTEIENLDVIYGQPQRRQPIVGLNVKNHYSYLEFTETLIQEFAHVLVTLDDEDHGV